MPTLTTVRPDATPLGSTNFTIFGGAPSINAALADNSVATYVQKGTTGNGTTTVGFGTTSIVSGTRVLQVRLRAQVLCPTSSSRLTLTPITRVNGVDFVGSTISFAGQYALAEYAGAYFTVAPDGYAWDQARIDGLRARIGDNATGVNLSNVYELFFDVVTTTQPTVTVTAPTSPVTGTSKPTVAWTYVDADGYDQDYYRIRVFSSAQYVAGGFDPSADTPVWDSGVVASGDNTATLDYYLTSGLSYRAYVIAAKTVGGEAYYSNYAYAQFTVTSGAPATPSLSASFNSSGNRVWLSASGLSVATATRTNLITNPSFEAGTSAWGGMAAAIAVSSVWSNFGTSSLSVTPIFASIDSAAEYTTTALSLGIVGGLTYNISAYCHLEAAQIGSLDGRARKILVYYQRSSTGGTYYSFASNQAANVAGTTRLSVSCTFPSDVTTILIRLYNGANNTATNTIYYDSVLVEQSSTLLPYFDGSVSDTQPRAYTVAWNGTAHASTSTLTYTGFDSQVFQVQRSDDSGTTWGDVTGASALIPSGAFVSTTFDYSAPRGETAQYRARSIGSLSGEVIGSAFSGTQNVSVLNDGTWWLKAVTTPALNRGGLAVAPGFNVERIEQIGVFRPIGRGTAVTVTAGLLGEDGKLEIQTTSRAEFEAVWLLCCHVGTLLLQTPDGDQRFIRVTSRSYKRDGTVRSPLTVISLDYVEVAA